MDMKSEKDHLLTLKVMRLTRPSLFTGISISSEPHDICGQLLDDEQHNDMAIPNPNTGVGQVLLLPQGFGNIYLGETFSCSICVHNGSKDTVNNVSLKAMLQMSSQKVPVLADQEDGTCQLATDAVLSKIINHEVKELGTHILVCEVQYQNLSGGDASFRKFYKFQVMKPLDVQTKFYNAESEEIFLEAGIENTTSTLIFLEDVTLEPAPCYTVALNIPVTPLNNIVGEDKSVFGNVGVVNPHDICQHLFCLRPTPEAYQNPTTLRQSLVIGKLDIVWRTSMGDRGRLQTSKLQKKMLASQLNAVKFSIDTIPSEVYIGQPFEVGASLHNISDNALSLTVDFLDGSSSIVWHFVTTKEFDDLKPGDLVKFTVQMMPLRLGLQNISRIKITEKHNRQSTTYENLAQVFVRTKHQKDGLEATNLTSSLQTLQLVN